MRNITDPDSRLMATRNGKQQSYNGQQVTSEDLLVIATELTDDPTDMAWFEPMMAQAQEAAALILACQPPAPAAPAQGSGDAPREPAGTRRAAGQRGRAARRPAGTRRATPASGDAPRQPGQRGRAAPPGTRRASHSRNGLGLADAGYLSRHNLTCPGPGPADRHRQAPRPGTSSPRHTRRRPGHRRRFST